MDRDEQMTSGAGHQVVRADHGDRAGRAWRMRVAGATWDEIAAAVGYANGANAFRAVKRFFNRVPEPDRELVRSTWRERHETLWRISLEDAAKRRPGAVRAAVALARSAAQLDGLDAPSRLELVNPDAREFEQVLEELRRRTGVGSPEPDLETIVDAEVVEIDDDRR
ncbi:hypothetical protein GE115_00125 [Agromyces sp. CFH 90414]|uniref:Uncharacterized protein n=1 Tax=Agromyces agglutinans TaxID=2662258 RepID=A0A6I2F3K1_9MICO|nr:hypothetical protein [Agromyces agglutinans]MRG58287.1 hypothetical protein [Agromyces agglutinans]